MNRLWHERLIAGVVSLVRRRWTEWLSVVLLAVLVVVAWRELGGLVTGMRARFAEGDANPELELLPPAGRAATDVLSIGFRDLRFDAPEVINQGVGRAAHYAEFAPASVRALDGRKVRLTGYLMPMRMDGPYLRECLIVPSQLNCCFGQEPRFCEFVVARMRDIDLPAVVDVPLMFTGTLRVGDSYDEGSWTAFYALDCSGVGR